jgi:hypothetical protein
MQMNELETEEVHRGDCLILMKSVSQACMGQ